MISLWLAYWDGFFSAWHKKPAKAEIINIREAS